MIFNPASICDCGPQKGKPRKRKLVFLSLALAPGLLVGAGKIIGSKTVDQPAFDESTATSSDTLSDRARGLNRHLMKVTTTTKESSRRRETIAEPNTHPRTTHPRHIHTPRTTSKH